MNRDEIKLHERQAIQCSLAKHPALLLVGPNTVARAQIVTTIITQMDLEPGETELVHNERHPDYHYFDGREATTEEVKEIRDAVSAHPARWTHRYLVITNAERLHPNATQSLLKLIEEPPPHLKIILTTDRYYSLYPTIRSRSPTLEIGIPPVKETEVLLEDQGYSEPVWRAKVSGGHPDVATGLDPGTTREWHKLWSAALNGVTPTPDNILTWTERIQQESEATTIALWHILATLAARKVPDKHWREVAIQAIRERERAHNGRTNKLTTATIIANTYALVKTAAKHARTTT
jgi:hypothetical protein